MSEKPKAHEEKLKHSPGSPQAPLPPIPQPKVEDEDDKPVEPVAKKFIESRIKAERKLAAEQPNKDKYFIFLTPDCGRAFYTVAGMSFCVFHTELSKDMTGQEFEMPVRGEIVHLTEAEAERLIEKIKLLKIRFVGESGTISRKDPGVCQDNEWPFPMFCGIYKLEHLVKEYPDYLTNHLLPTLQERDTTCLQKFGNGWVDAKGKPVPLKRDFVEQKIETIDYRTE